MRKALVPLMIVAGCLFVGTTVFASSLTVKIDFTKIEFYLDRPLQQAKGGLVPITISYAPSVKSVQVPRAVSYVVDLIVKPLSHTIRNADIRAILKPDEQKIHERCKNTLDFNRTDQIDTVHDAVIPFEVYSPDGTRMASTMVTYQLGLTCKRRA